METDLSGHCHHWPVKWNPALPERNQLVTWLILHQYSDGTFDNQIAIMWALVVIVRNSESLCLTATFFFCLLSSFFLSLLWLVFFKSPAHLSLVTLCSWNTAAFRESFSSWLMVRKLLCPYGSKSLKSSQRSERSGTRLWLTVSLFWNGLIQMGKNVILLQMSHWCSHRY